MLLNFLFGFPIPCIQTLKMSNMHFTWFPKKLFYKTSLASSKIVRLPLEHQKYKKKVFIGQPWDMMGLDIHQKRILREYINSECISLYVMHPRETREMLDLDSLNCVVIKSFSEVEKLFNFLDSFKVPLNIFSIASSAVINLPLNFSINLVYFGENTNFFESQKSLIKILNENNQEFNLIKATEIIN